jgi:hypothetical protein
MSLPIVENRKTLNRYSSFDVLWLSLGLLIILLIAFILPVVPNDYWWYLRLGQDILRTGSVPVQETFSYTRAGQPVVHPSWLSAVVFWLAYRTGGLTLTFLLRGIVLSLTYSVLWIVARIENAGPRLATALVLIAALSGANNWSFRPQLLAYPLFALTLWVLWCWNRGENKPLWIAPLLGVLWVNLHGSFALIFLLMGSAFILGRGDRKKLLLVLAVTTLATLLNPRGVFAWGQVVSMASSPAIKAYSAEWAPPLNNYWAMNIFFGWLLLFPVLASLSPRRLDRLSLTWFLIFGWLALTGIRYVIWFLFLLIPLTASLLADWTSRWFDRPARKDSPSINCALSAIMLLSTLIVLPGVRERYLKGPEFPLYAATPVDAITWLKAHPELPGPVWADVNAASYMIFVLPERPIWIDPRFEVYPLSQWQEYTAIDKAAPQWQSISDRYGINLFIVAYGSPTQLALNKSPVWCEQYQDEQAAIYTRCVKK